MPSIAETLTKINQRPAGLITDLSELRSYTEQRIYRLRHKTTKRLDVLEVDSNRLGSTLQAVIELMRGEVPPREKSLSEPQTTESITPVILNFDMGRDPNYEQGIGYYSVAMDIDPTLSPAAVRRVVMSTASPVRIGGDINLKIETIPNETPNPHRRADVEARNKALLDLIVEGNPNLGLWLLSQLSRVHDGKLEPLPPKIIADPWSNNNDPSIWGASAPLIPGRIHGHGAYRPPRHP